MSRFFLYILLFVTLAGVGTGCMRDDFSGIYEDEDGVRDVACEVVFSPVLDALEGTRATGGTPGNALNHVRSLCVIVYSSDSTFLRKYTQDQLIDYNVINNQVQISPGDALGEKGHQAEQQTPRATFVIPGLEFGKYYIYAVANMGDLEGYDISTTQKLKQISLEWINTDIAANDEMFGYFTTKDSMTCQGFTAPLVTVNTQLPGFHAWLKRAASKVTVAIDGSGLKDGVEVFIKSIQVRDIPKFCYLGQTHKAADHLLLEEEGGKIIVSTADGANGTEVVSRTSNYPNSPDFMAVAHSSTARSLFFYENMQGTGQSKHQSWDGGNSIKYPNGNTPGDNGYKDKKISGTYVEVLGYYKSTNPEKLGEGPIVYRFMLGKDTENDYNAERNYHYKLTLKLRNWANDSDWHIVYNPAPTASSSPQYISYLYGESMHMPIKISGASIEEITLKVGNTAVNKTSWAPHGADAADPKPYYTGSVDNPGPWNGFLQLCPITDHTISAPTGSEYTYNKTYFEEAGKDRNVRTYKNLSPGVHTTSLGDSYEVITNGAGDWTVKLPLYTRPRIMVGTTGYTGNNLFSGYQRWANVNVTVRVKNFDGDIVDVPMFRVPVYQVRRLVNPKGIWREHNNSKPFHIRLMETDGESMGNTYGNENFYPMSSVGPWHAVIEQGNWFTIEPTAGVSQRNPDGSISGVGDPYDDNNFVDFTFKPSGTIAANKARGGIITIYYNNNTCVHRIFVRQGYAPVRMYGTGPYWHSKNLVTATALSADPVVEGSYFRRYNLDLPIDASNNTVDMFRKNGLSRNFTIAGQTSKKKWENITTTKTKWDVIDINGVRCRLPTHEEYNAIFSNENTIYGYGVLYTGNSSETLENVTSAYNARSNNYTSGYGMRGLFICDATTGDQLFFPIGASGFGRFRQANTKNISSDFRPPQGQGGVIQYANRYALMNDATAQYKPLLYDIYRLQGALYWTAINRETEYGLDINYYSLNVYTALASGDLSLYYTETQADPSGSDAIQIRLVQASAPTASKPNN